MQHNIMITTLPRHQHNRLGSYYGGRRKWLLKGWQWLGFLAIDGADSKGNNEWAQSQYTFIYPTHFIPLDPTFDERRCQ